VGEGLHLLAGLVRHLHPDPAQRGGAVAVHLTLQVVLLDGEFKGVGDRPQLRVPVIGIGPLEAADRRRGEFLALGLADVEDVSHPEGVRRSPHNPLLPALGVEDVQAGDHWREDGDAVLPLAHVAAQAQPGVKAGHPGGVGTLARDSVEYQSRRMARVSYLPFRLTRIWAG
jgi:hypothetical protein